MIDVNNEPPAGVHVQLAGCCAYCLTVDNETRQAVAIYRGSSLCEPHLRQLYDEVQRE